VVLQAVAQMESGRRKLMVTLARALEGSNALAGRSAATASEQNAVSQQGCTVGGRRGMRTDSRIVPARGGRRAVPSVPSGAA
jgi:hypothetical protein